LIGTGTSDYLDALIEPPARAEAGEMIFSFLAAQRHRWDTCDFQQLPPGSFLLDAPAQIGWTDNTAEQETSVLLRLPDKIQSLFRAVPRHQLQNLQYYRSRAEMNASIRAERLDAGEMEEFFDALRRFQVIHRGNSAVLAGEATWRFHLETASKFLARGAARLYALRSRGRIIAGLYGFAHQGRMYYYLGGYDLEFARLSPGTLIIGHAIEEAAREGMREFDFLRGRETYKYLWGAADQANYRRWLRHGGPPPGDGAG
jgi:CelD/BcsL family acetyltransferase involved in cellulose biosynthesis